MVSAQGEHLLLDGSKTPAENALELLSAGEQGAICCWIFGRESRLHVRWQLECRRLGLCGCFHGRDLARMGQCGCSTAPPKEPRSPRRCGAASVHSMLPCES